LGKTTAGQSYAAWCKRFLDLHPGVPQPQIDPPDQRVAAALKAVLLRVLPLRPALSLVQLRAEVAAHADLLPEPQRHRLWLDWLAELVEQITSLAQQHLSSPVADPLPHLDQVAPDWRQSIPLPLAEPGACALLDDLLLAAYAAGQAQPAPMQLRRGLQAVGQQSPQFAVQLQLVQRCTRGQLAQLLACEELDLPVAFDLAAVAGSASRLVARGTIRAGVVTLQLLHCQLPAAWFALAVHIELSHKGQLLYRLDLPGGMPPDLDAPCLFADQPDFAALLHCGSCTLPADSVLLLLPQHAGLFSMEADPQSLPSPQDGLSLYRLPAGDWAIGLKPDSYRVRCGAGLNGPEHLQWQGSRYYLDSSPAALFKGVPSLNRQSAAEDWQELAPQVLFWQSADSSHSLATEPEALGTGRLLYKQGDQVQARLSAVCLPDQASIEYQTGETAVDGMIYLLDWPVDSVTTLSREVELLVARNDDDWRLTLHARGDTPPAQVEFQLHWPGGVQRLTLPFPSVGVVLLPEQGEPLAANPRLTLAQLAGVSARLFNPRAEAGWNLRVSMRTRASGTLQRTLAYPPSDDGGLRVVPLEQLLPMLRQLLSCVDQPDVRLDLTFESEGQRYPGLRVVRDVCDTTSTASLESDGSALAQALALASRDEQLAALAEVFDSLQRQPQHADWALLAQQLAQLGNRPDAGHDLWQAMARQPDFMAMALLQLDGLADNWPQQLVDAVPFEWLLLSPETWRNCLQNLKGYWQAQSEAAWQAVVPQVTRKLQELLLHAPELKFSLAYAQSLVLQGNDPSIALLEHNPALLRHISLAGLFGTDDSASMQLLRRSVQTAAWPKSLKKPIEQFARSTAGAPLLPLLENLRGDFKLLTVLLPLMLAHEVAQGRATAWMQSPELLAALREYRDFDADWFEQAYQAGLILALVDVGQK
jgi:hypothetical protein